MTRANPRRRAPRPTIGARLPFELAPALSAIGLVIVAAVSFALLGGSLPVVPGGGPDGPIRTATPSGVVITPDDPRAKVPGSLLYVKDGNIWVQQKDEVRQVTTGGRDSMPTWAPDGTTIYFVRTRSETGRWPSLGETRTYDLDVPTLYRIGADGSGEPVAILNGRFKRSGNTWSFFIRQPSIAPDGATAAIVTDGPDPTRGNLVVKLVDLATGEITDPNLAQVQRLGHQDPAFSPDGRFLLYVRNAREGSRGTPIIYRYNLANDRSTAISASGYADPAWSRDGRYIAATRTSAFGTDVVILDATNGTELVRVTRDDSSFSPVWSPEGDALAFFRVTHGLVDLYLVELGGTGPSWTVGEPVALTISAGLDAASRPGWFIPESELPPLPTATPAPAASAPDSSAGQ